MPAPIFYAHAILRSLSEARHAGKTPLLGPDAKSQVTLEYIGGKPVRATKIVVSVQHSEQIEREEVREIVRPHVLATLPRGWMCDEEHFLVNPTGRFVIGGPHGDAGVTGRKIIVDTYGGAAPHGGGAFSGKDPTKVDRSAAYGARYLAKNVVGAGLAERCTIQVAYAIGVVKTAFILCRHRWGRHRRTEARGGAAGTARPVAAWYPHTSGPQQADLQSHLRLWPFWPTART